MEITKVRGWWGRLFGHAPRPAPASVTNRADFTNLVDHREGLFGRGRDLRFLLDRAERTGLTAITGNPQIGKSWLMMETARLLGEDRSVLVGFFEARGRTHDHLLRAITDLYQRWLFDAELFKQARMVWQQQKKELLPAFAKAFGEIAKEVPSLAKPAGVVVKKALDGLVDANKTLITGGVSLPILQYDQARELVKSVADIADCRIALFLDAWSNPVFEVDTFKFFLSHQDEWPRCHVFLALRPDDEDVLKAAEGLQRDHPDAARVYPLQELRLEGPAEQQRLLSFLPMTAYPLHAGPSRTR